MGQQFEFEQMNNQRPAINTDPREQTGQASQTNYPYHDMGNRSGQKIYPTNRRRRRWPVVVLIVVLVLGLLGAASVFGQSVFGKTIALPQHSFQVSGTPTLVIKNDTGKIQIHRGDVNQVSVKASEHTGLFSNPDDVQVTTTQNANEIDVIVTNKKGFSIGLNYESIDLDVTLPSTSNIQATIDTGSIQINDISGQMNLIADTGSIDVEHGDLSSNSNLKADTGSITFKQGTISGQTLFSTDTGEITFDGKLTPGGTYNFTTDTGSVDISLPSDTSFSLDATVSTGSVNNDFGSNVVGSGPSSKVQVHTDTGSIDIHKK